MASSNSKLAVFQSVVAAMFGVQSQNKRAEDFNNRRFWPFAVGGVIFVAAFVIILVWFVNAVVLA
ncbi:MULTISPECIES: DUF2970 domain-containing protein [unclassified Pseudoalteromonas]|uniref:DUF2970 domain-containing protein n=1 Tax=unclassified Pseudoalteromonas TaxID=194690 RepID=UPI0030154B0D